jgi:hypothetical protein
MENHGKLLLSVKEGAWEEAKLQAMGKLAKFP